MNNLILPKSIDEIVLNLLGPTSEEIGKDLGTLYKKGVEMILRRSYEKLKNPKDGKVANLRVARDIFWNGSFTDEAISAEYFGGILAASRSENGKNDEGVFYVDIIKSLSSGQLMMHYVIYRTLNKELIANARKKTLNPGQENELARETIFFPLPSIMSQFRGADLIALLHGLFKKGLIDFFQVDNYESGEGEILPYLQCKPSPLGVQLFAIANNMFSDWLKFSVVDFGDFRETALPEYYAQSMESLLEKVGQGKKEGSNTAIKKR